MIDRVDPHGRGFIEPEELRAAVALWYYRLALPDDQREGLGAQLGGAIEPEPEPALAANTLSAIRYPAGVDAAMLASVRERGVIIAGGLHPDLKHAYFRVGHMGRVIGELDRLGRTVEAIGLALSQHGHPCDVSAALKSLEEIFHA